MGQASAVPDDLYAYSDQTTQAEAELQRWIRTTLTPAIETYQSGAIDFGGDIPDLTLQRPGPSGGSIDTDAANYVDQVATTDKQVRAVGKAFQDAGDAANSTIPPWVHNRLGPGQSPFRYATVATDDLTILEQLAAQERDLRLQRSLQAGLDLAAQFDKGPITAAMWQQLAANENDPDFALAFFNTLDAVTLKKIILQSYVPGDVTPHYYGEDLFKAFAAALSTGSLDSAVCDAIVDMMPIVDSRRFTQLLITSLETNQAAATDFIRQLDQSHLHQLLDGDFQMPGTSRDHRQIVVFSILLNAAQSYADDPAATRDFLAQVGAAMAGVTSDDPQDVERSLTALLTYCSMNIITAPADGTEPADLSAGWATDLGTTLGGLLAPFLHWAMASDKNIQSRHAAIEGVFENVVTGILTAPLVLIGGPTGFWAKFAVGAGVNALSNAFTSWMQSAVHPSIPYQDIPLLGPYLQDPNANADAVAMVYAQEKAQEFMLVVNLIKTGQVVPRHGPQTALDLSSSDTILDVLNHPDRYAIGGTNDGKLVLDVLDAFRTTYYQQALGALATG